MGQAQNLAKVQNSQSKSGTGRGMERYQILTACPFPSCETNRDRAEKDVLKQEKDVLKQESKRVAKSFLS